jgi:hypothetical protein|tara:strand:- start:1089 stop:1460 length:372 start_codon:yes stop_codon:yes gene_type:complete
MSKQANPDTEEDGSLPFPRARVVNLMRLDITEGKQIRSEVKDAVNNWLGNLLSKVSQEMNRSPYGSIGIADFQRATMPYDQMSSLVKDEERLHLSLEKLKADADQVQRDMRRFFEQITGSKEE